MAAEGNADVLFTFRFTYANGDFYEGFGFADAATGYATGTRFDTVDQNGLTGTYEITSVEEQGEDLGLEGTVVVSSYWDAETATFLSADGSGSGGLGSEAGHIYDQTDAVVGFFSSVQEAEAPLGTPPAPPSPQPEPPQSGEEPPPVEEPQAGDGTNDVLFTYTYAYGNGDFYNGFGYVDESAGLQTGQVIADTLANETGNIGTWTITGTEAQGQDLGFQGMVFVEAYGDAALGGVSPATGGGSFGLGSETGTFVNSQASVADTRFNSKIGIDARPAEADQRFTYTYFYGNGDFYQGYGFVDVSQGFAVGDQLTETEPNATGQLGHWEITSVEETGVDFNLQDQVQVTAYFDSESGKMAERITAGGMDGLGSEGGLVYWHSASSPRGIAFDGFDRFTEADRPIFSGANAQDERFTYTYFYGNGDSYSGSGFADVGDGLDAGQFLFSSQVNALGQRGFYHIESTEQLGADLGLEEQISVDRYFDASTGATAVQVTGSGTSGLGSETGTAFWDEALTNSTAFSSFTPADPVLLT